jgi:hypothetical protein
VNINQSKKQEGDVNAGSPYIETDFTYYDSSPAGLRLHKLYGASYVTQ